MSDIKLGKGDTDDKDCILTLDGLGINLTAYKSVIFRMRQKNNVNYRITINCAPGVKTPSENGGVRIPFTNEHTKIAGEFEGQFIITDSNNKNLTIPLGTKVSITIYDVV